jgi:hypothetical protein
MQLSGEQYGGDSAGVPVLDAISLLAMRILFCPGADDERVGVVRAAGPGRVAGLATLGRNP